MTAQARRVAVGDDPPGAEVEAGKQQVPPVAVLGAERGLVEGHAGRLPREVRAELLGEGSLNDEDVGAEDFAGGDLSVDVGQGAGGVHDVALQWGGTLACFHGKKTKR